MYFPRISERGGASLYMSQLIIGPDGKLVARRRKLKPTHIERYLVSCYDAADGGVFHPHRDDTTFGTAHRKFACSLNSPLIYRSALVGQARVRKLIDRLGSNSANLRLA